MSDVSAPASASGVRTLMVRVRDWAVLAAGVPAEVPAVVVAANRVTAASPAARAEGVTVGMRRRQAQSRCPELAVVAVDEARDARTFESVIAAVEAVTPRIEVIEPGRCSFPTRGPSRYLGGDEPLAARVHEVVVEAVSASTSWPAAAVVDLVGVGIADGAFAAALATRAGLVVGPGVEATAAFLAPLPVAALGRPALVDLLRRLGIITLGQLADLPERHVADRFGADGLVSHRLARGLDEQPAATREARPDLAVVAELDPPAEQVEAAAFVAKGLADELHAALADQGLACVRVTVEAETEHGEVLTRQWRHEGLLSSSGIAQRVRWQLDGWLTGPVADRPTSGVSVLRLIPDEVVPDTGRQLGFWGGDVAAADRAARSLARVQALVGIEAVTMARLIGGRAPGERVELVPVIPGDLSGGARPAGRRASAEVPPWPGQVPDPAPAVVHASSPSAVVGDERGRPVGVSGRGHLSAAPASVAVAGGAPVAVEGWAGPWPADERWWDGSRRRRRARCQVVTADGRAHLLTLESGSWTVEATYD